MKSFKTVITFYEVIVLQFTCKAFTGLHCYLIIRRNFYIFQYSFFCLLTFFPFLNGFSLFFFFCNSRLALSSSSFFSFFSSLAFYLSNFSCSSFACFSLFSCNRDLYVDPAMAVGMIILLALGLSVFGLGIDKNFEKGECVLESFDRGLPEVMGEVALLLGSQPRLGLQLQHVGQRMLHLQPHQKNL